MLSDPVFLKGLNGGRGFMVKLLLGWEREVVPLHCCIDRHEGLSGGLCYGMFEGGGGVCGGVKTVVCEEDVKWGVGGA